MREWTRDVDMLELAIGRETDEMRQCRETDEEHGCTEWYGACDHCTTRIDYLSALRTLLALRERELDAIEQAAADYLSQPGEP